MIDFENLTCECNGNLVYYDNEIVDEFDDGCISIRYHGRCDTCHKKYTWQTKYQPIKTFGILTNS